MSNPALCFGNYVDFFDPDDKAPPGITATTEATNYPVENISNWRIQGEDRWKASSKDYQIIEIDFGVGIEPQPDTYILAGHNTSAGSANTVHGVYWSDNPAGGYTNVAAAQAPPTDAPYMKTFTVGAGHRYWALDFQVADANVEVGQWFLGKRLDFPVGLQPGIDYFSGAPAFYNDSPISGSPIGRAVSHINKSIRLDWDSPGFDANLELGGDQFYDYANTPDYDVEFLRHLADGTPFWFSPDNDNQPEHLYMGYADGFSTPFDGSLKRRTFSGTMTAFSEVF